MALIIFAGAPKVLTFRPTRTKPACLRSAHVNTHDDTDLGRRRYFDHAGLRLSYLDYGGTGPVLLALHGHLNEGTFVEQGAVPPGTDYRVIALDQRGHGESDHAHSCATDRYVDDALALLDHLGVRAVVILGHSLGDAVAHLLAAPAPERVTGLVVVDIGAIIDDSCDMTLSWPRRTTTQSEPIDAMGFMGAKQAYVMRQYPDGWGVPVLPQKWPPRNVNSMVTTGRSGFRYRSPRDRSPRC